MSKSVKAIHSINDFSTLTVTPQIQVTLDCNSDCSYCFQKHYGGIMDISTIDIILQKSLSINKRNGFFANNNTMPVTWHGGEPLLAGVEFYREVVGIESQVSDIVFDNRIQTNGTLMTEAFAKFFVENNFAVGFSLDGPEDLHNQNRNFRNSGNGTFADTMYGIELYRSYANPDQIPVIAVITSASLGREHEIYEFFKQIGAKVQLDIYDIKCLDMSSSTQNHTNVFDLAPTSEEAGQFLINLFDLWFYDQTRKVEFSDMRDEVKMILQPKINIGDPFKKKRCDFKRTIFAPDGKVYSCDQYINDEKSALGDIRKDSLEDILERKACLWEEIKLHVRESGDNMACSSCQWGSQCSGGCMTCMKYSSLLLNARSEGLADNHWYSSELTSPLKEVSGEFYYCDGLRAFRSHVKEAVAQELSSV
jgi:uncharacterized protein